MTHAHRHTVATAAAGITAYLLLAACASSPTNATAPAAQINSTATKTSARAPGTSTGTLRGAAVPRAHTSATPQPAATIAGACALITETDVTRTVGTDPGKGGGDSSHGASGCAYGSYPGQVLTVNVLPARGEAAYARARHDPRLTSSTGSTVVKVSGVGDQAFELSGAHADVIYLTKGDALIVIGFTAPTSPTKGAALALAKIAASRL
jgi:hypothetical protein